MYWRPKPEKKISGGRWSNHDFKKSKFLKYAKSRLVMDYMDLKLTAIKFCTQTKQKNWGTVVKSSKFIFCTIYDFRGFDHLPALFFQSFEPPIHIG